MWDRVRIGFLIFVCLVVAYRIGYRNGATKTLDVLVENPKLLEMYSEIKEYHESIFPELKKARDKLEKEETK